MTDTSKIQAQARILQVIGYHQETKHHFHRYARSLGYMDWSNQPNPFRRYEGAPVVSLPLLRPEEDPVSPLYSDLYRSRAVVTQPITVRTLSRFFEYALALSAWKETGEARWALRSNPSSGNLHPTEGYLLVDGIPGLQPTPGLYHYAPKDHALECRAAYTRDWFAGVIKAFPTHAFLFALTSIHWRESWKYGERGFRYCQHDAGHAIGTARIAAATLGWRMVLLDDVGDDLLAALLGIRRADDVQGAEREHPDCVAVIWPREQGGVSAATDESRSLPLTLGAGLVEDLTGATWHGKANRLSRDLPDPWEIIDVVAAASWKPPTDRGMVALDDASRSRDGSSESVAGLTVNPSEPVPAGHLIRQRRSAVAFDGKTGISAVQLLRMMARVFPGQTARLLDRPMPWDAIPWEPTIHLGLFIHRVEGLAPGLYLLIRDVTKMESVRQAMHKHFEWSKPTGCPNDLPLYLLEAGDARRLAAQVSCHQEIAGDSAFSLGMLAEFEPSLLRHGAWFYRRLFWETGLIGQVLYLEAEAAGVRATGIGCFFDDPVHQVFGLTDTTFQSLYHFTMGGHVDDPRLTTLLPYSHLSSR